MFLFSFGESGEQDFLAEIWRNFKKRERFPVGSVGRAFYTKQTRRLIRNYRSIDETDGLREILFSK